MRDSRFKEAGKFLLRVTVDAVTKGRFLFHGRHHDPAGSYLDMPKVVAKALNRRYEVKDQVLDSFRSRRIFRV